LNNYKYFLRMMENKVILGVSMFGVFLITLSYTLNNSSPEKLMEYTPLTSQFTNYLPLKDKLNVTNYYLFKIIKFPNGMKYISILGKTIRI